MLEILFIIALWKKMGEKMRGKGYERPLGFQILVPIAWFGGEFLGAFVYAIVRAIMGQQDTGFDIVLYVIALLTAAVFTGGLFLIVGLFERRVPCPPPLPPQLG